MKQPLYDEQRERLLDAACHVIDFLPRRVPREAGRYYFPVEEYLAAPERIGALYRRFARVVLCLSCYDGIAADRSPGAGEEDSDWIVQPAPETLVSLVEGCADGGYLTLLFPDGDALLTLDGGDLYLTAYNLRGEFLDTVRQLAAAEGLFLREAWSPF